MKAKPVGILIAGICLSAAVGGCTWWAGITRQPPPPPRDAKGRAVEVLDLSAAPADEVDAAVTLEEARVNYRYRLTVLQGYYTQLGDMTKLTWAQRETENLDKTKTFSWVGMPTVTAPKGESIVDADERLLVEYVVTARRKYVAAADRLRGYYQTKGATFKASLIRNMQARLDPVRVYMYFLTAEVPGEDVRPSAVVPEADSLYAKALRMHRGGKVLPGITDYSKQRHALVLFRKLVDRHPTSNKVAQAAYYIGEIYKEYYQEHVRSVHWYRRAWQWDPNLTLPARFQAATVYDFHLQNKDEAAKCYRGVILHEQFNGSNVRYSHQRYKELTGRPAIVTTPKRPPG